MKKKLFFALFMLNCFSGFLMAEEAHFRRALLSAPISLDPAIHDDLFSMAVTLQVYEGLLDYDENSQVVPALATRWSISQERKVYTFYLKKGVTFHNGQSFTARDVLYSFTRMIDAKIDSPGFWVFENVKGYKEFREGKSKNVSGLKIIDNYTFQVELQKPYYPFLQALATANAKIVPYGATRAS